MTPTEVRLQLCRAGYAPIPVVGKVPPMEKWQERTDTSEGDIEIWAKTYDDADNTGIITRNTPAFDVDILNPAAAEAVEDLVRKRFEERGKIVVRLGLAPKRLIPFQCQQPFKKIAVPLATSNGGSGRLNFSVTVSSLSRTAPTRIRNFPTLGSAASPVRSSVTSCPRSTPKRPSG
jgi:hypothetical protein